MTEIRTALLDLDGTLVDASEVIVDVVLDLARTFGLDVPERRWLHGRIGADPNETWRLMGASDPAPIQQALREHHATRIDTGARVLEGVPEALEALAEHEVRLALVTTRVVASARATLEHCGLSHWFETVVGRDLVPAPKPAPHGILLALERLGSSTLQAVMIGDTDADVGAARAAGVRCWAVLGGVGSEKGLREAGADLILSGGIAEVPAQLRQMTGGS